MSQEHKHLATDESDQVGTVAISKEELREIPPSDKLVLKVLESDGPLTQMQLAAETRLAKRTVRAAATRLEEMGVLERRVYIPDARQFEYVLTVELPA